jgi:hypothetical protein
VTYPILLKNSHKRGVPILAVGFLEYFHKKIVKKGFLEDFIKRIQILNALPTFFMFTVQYILTILLRQSGCIFLERKY